MSNTLSQPLHCGGQVAHMDLAVLTYKVRSMLTPVYLHNRIMERVQPNFTFIYHPAASPAIHQDGLFQANFQIFSTVFRILAATSSIDQRLSVYF